MIDQALPHADVTTDYEGDSRMIDNSPDIGAEVYIDDSVSTNHPPVLSAIGDKLIDEVECRST